MLKSFYPTNEFQQEFYQRIEDANRFFRGEGIPGESLYQVMQRVQQDQLRKRDRQDQKKFSYKGVLK
jgi:hypothetical protein